jgi:hypothetical protein
MRRRSAPRRSSSLRWLFWLGGVLLVVLILLWMALPSLVISYVQSFLRSDAFREKAEQVLAAKLGGTARMESLVWHDDTAQISMLEASGSALEVQAQGVHASLDFAAIRSGKWSVQNASADELTIHRDAKAAVAMRSAAPPSEESAGMELPGWIQRHIPRVVEVDGFLTERFNLELLGGLGRWKLEGSKLRLNRWESETTSAKSLSISQAASCSLH